MLSAGAREPSRQSCRFRNALQAGLVLTAQRLRSGREDVASRAHEYRVDYRLGCRWWNSVLCLSHTHTNRVGGREATI